MRRYHDRAHSLADLNGCRDAGDVAVAGAARQVLELRGSGVARPGRVTLLLRTSDLVLGEFRCAPDDELWLTDNEIGDLPHVVWPLTTVEISRPRIGTMCADPNRVVLYDPGTEYRRRQVAPTGDRSLFLALRPDVFVQWPDAELHPYRERFKAGQVWCSPRAWLYKEAVVAAARSGRADPVQLEEMALEATYDVLTGPSARPSASSRRHVRDRVENARILLGQRLAEQLHISTVAHALGVSPFHLARQFRDETGTSMYAYRTELRARAAVHRMFDKPDSDLSAIAADHGFASHSHFTATCRRVLGAPPSALRTQVLRSAADTDPSRGPHPPRILSDRGVRGRGARRRS